MELVAAALLKQCSSEHLANIAWSYAVAGWMHRLFDKPCIEALLEKMDSFGIAGLSQYQWHLWYK